MNVVDRARLKREEAAAAAAARPAPDPWMTAEEIAADLRISKMTVYRAIEKGLLRHVPVGRLKRVRTSWYGEWIAAGCPTGKGKS